MASRQYVGFGIACQDIRPGGRCARKQIGNRPVCAIGKTDLFDPARGQRIFDSDALVAAGNSQDKIKPVTALFDADIVWCYAACKFKDVERTAAIGNAVKAVAYTNTVNIIALAAEQPIGSSAARQDIVAVQTVQPVVTEPAFQTFACSGAIDHIVAIGGRKGHRGERCRRPDGAIGKADFCDAAYKRRVGAKIYPVSGSGDFKGNICLPAHNPNLGWRDTGPELKLIGPKRIDDAVLPVAAVEYIFVVASTAFEHVVAAAADKNIVRSRTNQRVVASQTVQAHNGAIAGEPQPVIASASCNRPALDIGPGPDRPVCKTHFFDTNVRTAVQPVGKADMATAIAYPQLEMGIVDLGNGNIGRADADTELDRIDTASIQYCIMTITAREMIHIITAAAVECVIAEPAGKNVVIAARIGDFAAMKRIIASAAR